MFPGSVFENHLLQPADRLQHPQQGQALLLVPGNLVTEKGFRRRGLARPSVEYALQVIGEQVMIFGPLLGNHLLRNAAEGVCIALRPGLDKLPQKFSMRRLARPCTKLRIVVICPEFKKKYDVLMTRCNGRGELSMFLGTCRLCFPAPSYLAISALYHQRMGIN